MRNITTGQGSYGNNRDGTAAGELYRFLVNLRQIRVKRTGHRVFGRNLVHTVGHDSQRIGIRSHIRKQYQYFFIIVYRKIFGRSQCHIRNQQTFHRRIFSCIHEADDTVECACIGEYVFEVQVIVIRHTHTTEDNLVGFRTQGYIGHHLIEGLVRVCEKRDFLSGHQGIVQVDTCDTGCNQFGRLLTTHRVHGRTADFHFLTFDRRTAVDRITKGVEETSSKLVAHFDCRSLAQEHYLCIRRNTFGTLENLQSHIVTGNLNHLGQLAVYGCQLIIPYPRSF